MPQSPSATWPRNELTTEADRGIRTWQLSISRFFVVTALSSLAIGQPLLDLYGAHPAIFSSADLTRTESWLFVALVLLVPPMTATAVTVAAHTIDERLGRFVHLTSCALLLALFGLVVARHVSSDSDIVSLATASMIAAAGIFALATRPVMTMWLRYASLLAPLIFLAFLFGSRSGPLLWQDEAQVVETTPTQNLPPTLIVIFDELSLAPLLTSVGSINADRFPGISGLADASTWYRNAASVSNLSEHAVPAILTGQLPDFDRSPFSWDHPKNLFTLFGNLYRIDAHEPLTSLCPSAVCATQADVQSRVLQQEIVVDDLLEVAAGLDLPNGAALRPVSIAGLGRDSLWSHAPLSVDLPLPAVGGLLQFSYGIAGEEAFTSDHADGVLFQVNAQYADGSEQTLFEDTYIPGVDPVFPEWRSTQVDLSGSEPAVIGLSFITDDRGNANYDWSAWSEIEITRTVERDGEPTVGPTTTGPTGNSAPPLSAEMSAPGNLRRFLEDALIVYGHLSLPPSLVASLPQIDSSWGDFTDHANEATTGNGLESTTSVQPDILTEDEAQSIDIGEIFQAFRKSDSGAGQLAVLETMVEHLIAASSAPQIDERPPMAVFHGIIPHRPYELTPDGRVYKTDTYANWGTSEHPLATSRQFYQRYLMQVANVDQILNEMIDALQQGGVWDDLLLIVVADHGITWRPEANPRESVHDPEGASDIFRVPLFVKLPQQAVGRIDDCPASTIDVLPTIVAALQVSTDWQFDGADLTSGCPAREERDLFDAKGNQVEGFGEGLDDLFERAVAYREWVAEEGGVGAIAAIGRSAPLVGGFMPDDAPRSTDVETWTLDQRKALKSLVADPPAGSAVPAWVSGEIKIATDLSPGTEGLIVVDGIHAGVVVQLDGAKAGTVPFSAIIDVALLRNGPATTSLTIHLPDGSLFDAGPPSD